MTEGKMRLKRFSSKTQFYHFYAAIFQQDYYQGLAPKSLNEWIEAVSYKACYYASSLQYENKLKSIIKKYGLGVLPTHEAPKP